MRPLPLILLPLLLLAGCQHTAPSHMDARWWAEGVQEDAAELAAAVSASPSTWGQCAAGVVLRASADYAALSMEVEDAIRAGVRSGVIVMPPIDPSVCEGLPGQPDSPEGIRVSMETVDEILGAYDLIVTRGARWGQRIAELQGSVEWWIAFDLIQGWAAHGSSLARLLVAMLEEPGIAFTPDPVAWDVTDCPFWEEPTMYGPRFPAYPEEID